MARAARQLSESGYMHLIVRGIGKQVLFEDRADRVYYLSLLRRYSSETEISVCAYCLMENHVHLLVHDKKEQTPSMMKKLGVSYALHFNRKYERVGHLFQDRFKSEAVEDDQYFLTVLRYILRNPVKAGICTSPADYPYCNIDDLLSGKVLSLPCDLSIKELTDFIMQDTDDTCMEISDKPRRGVTDAAAKDLIQSEFGSLSPVISPENRESTALSIQRLSKKGVSIRQLSRLTGISKSVIERMLG